MLIIVEGVDGVGKSTLVNCLEKHLRDVFGGPVEVLHRGPPTAPNMLEEYELPLQDYRPGQGRHVICDRWHVGEDVYGPLLRDGSRTTPAERRHIDLFLESRGALVVHVLAPTETVLERRRIRGEDDLLTDEQVPQVIDRYLDALWNTTVHTREVMWWPGVDNPFNDLSNLVGFALRLEHTAYNLNEFTTYVGSPAVSYLILGERRNQNSDTRWEAAFVPLPSSSGDYLFRHLPESVVMDAGVANVVEEEHRLDELLMGLRHPLVLTLGTVAHDVLEERHYPHGSAPHPQFVRRFHHHHGDEYGQVLRRALVLQEDHLSWRP